MAQGIITSATNAGLLKEMWPQAALDLMFYKTHVFSAMVPKKGDFYGKIGAWHNVVEYAPPAGGVSRQFSTARSNRSTGAEADFVIRRKRMYQVIEIDNEVIAASESDKGAIVQILRHKSKTALEHLGRRHARALFGNEGGSLARIAVGGIGTPSAGPQGGTVFTLTAGTDAVAFEVDQQIVADDTDGTPTGAAPHAGRMRVVAVDRNLDGAATVELFNDATGDGTVPAGWAASDYLFAEGDFGLDYTGLASWLPTDRSILATPFLGVDRSVDPERLAGVYEDFRGISVLEAIKRLATRVRLTGQGEPDMALCSPLDFEVLESEVESTVRRTETTVMPSGKRGAAIGFEGIEVRSGNSKVRVYEDIDCPRGVVYVLERGTWKFSHLKEIGHWATEGMSGQSRASENADAQEMRARIWGNLGCLTPGKNGVALIGA